MGLEREGGIVGFILLLVDIYRAETVIVASTPRKQQHKAGIAIVDMYLRGARIEVSNESISVKIAQVSLSPVLFKKKDHTEDRTWEPLT